MLISFQCNQDRQIFAIDLKNMTLSSSVPMNLPKGIICGFRMRTILPFKCVKAKKEIPFVYYT